MPDTHPPPIRIHDWTRVDDGTWHSFHYQWIATIDRHLNMGGLPDGYYSNAERHVGRKQPDVVTLQEATDEIMDDLEGFGDSTAVAASSVATEPQLSLHVAGDGSYSDLQLRVVIRHESGDRIVAILELTSPANKDRSDSVDKFLEKATAALDSGVHVSIIDLLPPTKHDAPHGLIGHVATAAHLQRLSVPQNKPLMVGAFASKSIACEPGPVELWAEPLAVGDALPDLPIFYREDRFVNIPLAATYAAAWEATPKRWRKVIEADAAT
jgi:hypothetical protein